MDFDWTKPMIIDWSGRSGPLFTEHALENCVIKRIINNTYCAPFCEKKYIREIPKWNPRDPYGTDIHRNDNFSYRLFIPGNMMLPAFPQVSTLTRIQQQQGVRVLSSEYEYVQPHQYTKPSEMDHLAFQEIKELYEAEQKQYLNWAKLLWLNEGCLKALRPKPIIEQVYEAEFKMRAHEIQSWPQNYVLAAQIPLESNKDTFELELKSNLLNVDVQDLPEAHYPKVMEKPLSILLNSCPTPEPCKDHICKFVLPHEESMSTLPLSEIHRDLADFASSHDCSVIASENALSCLLETDRKWHIPVSVIQVASSEHGDNRSIVVLGNEFAIQKTCATHRTYRAYKHLLRETFAPLTIQHDHQQKANAKTAKPVNVAETKVSNEEHGNVKQLVDRSEQKKLVVDESTDKDPEICTVDGDFHQNYFNESDEDLSSDTERLIIADPVETNAETSCSHDASKQNYTNKVFTAPGYSHVDHSSEFFSEPSTTKFATPILFEKNDAYTALLKTNKNTASKSDKANQGHASLIKMKENTTLKINEATQCVTRKLPEMDTNTLSETNEPTPGDARKLPEMGTNILSETNEPTPGDACKLLEMDTNTASETNEATQSVTHKLPEMNTSTALETNEPTQGDACRLLEMDTNTAPVTNEPTHGVARKFIEMDTNTASGANEPTQGITRSSIEMGKHHTPKLCKTINVTSILLETNTDHVYQAKNLETSTRVCSYKPLIRHELSKVSISPTKHMPPINPSSFETKTREPTYFNKHISNDANTFEMSKPKVDTRTHNTRTMMRKLSDSESFSIVNETVTARKLLATGITNNSSYGSTLKEPVTGPIAGKRARTLFYQINLEHNYYQLMPETLESIENRRLGVNNSKASLDEPDSNKSSFGDSRRLTTNIESIHKSSVRKYSSSAPAIASTKSKTPDSTYAELVRNVECNKSSAEGKPGKINFSELFGDESDSEEPILCTSNKSEYAIEDNRTKASHRLNWLASHEIKPTRIPNSILDSYISIIKPTKTHKRKPSSGERTRKLNSIKKRPLKSCLKNTRFDQFINTTTRRLPSYSKAKHSEPIVIDSDYSMSISGSDEEEAILGFHNGSAVPITRQPKSSKEAIIKTCQKDTFTRMYNERSSQIPKRISKKSVLKKKNNEFTINQSNKKNYAMQSCLNLFSTTDEPDNSITDTKTNVALRSRGLSTRLQEEESECPQKTNCQENNLTEDCAIIVERLSICLHSDEGNDNNTNGRNDTKTNERNDTKTKQVTLKRSRRVSTRVQAEENCEPHKNNINEPNDAKTNEQNDTKTKQVALRRRRRLSTRVQAEQSDGTHDMKTNQPIEAVALTLNISERTKRYLRRSLNFECSDSDRESGDEMSKGTRKCMRSASPSVSSSDAESNTEMNIFHFTTISDTDTDDSDDENTLTIDCPPPDRTEESQATVIPNDKTRKIEMAYYTSAASTASETSTILPATIHPKVETKPVDATRALRDTQPANVGSRNRKVSSSEQLLSQNERLQNANASSQKAIFDVIGVNRCTCKGTKFAVPPPRSFKKWQLKNYTSNDAFDIIVHSSHKVRKGENEVILEPIVEFQPELGGSRQSECKLRALDLALLTRPRALLVNVRVNHENGEVMVIEECGRGAGEGVGEARRGAVAGALHTALAQLRRLLPGQYVLAHDPSHGSNAMLYSTKGLASVQGEGYAGQRLSLRADNINMPDAEEALYAKIPPALAPVLLPYHKSRGMLPLAFTPLRKNVRAPKKIAAALAKVKLPPHGIKWPKKKKKKNKPRELCQERQAEHNSMPSEI